MSEKTYMNSNLKDDIEDFLTPDDFVSKFAEYAESYDADDQVELYAGMRGTHGVPNTIRELLDDCQEAKDTLMEIAYKLQKAIVA